MDLPDTYLGLLLTTKEVTNTFWNTIVERFQKKLVGWKGKTLSNVGKLQLLSVALQGIPIYFLSLFKINQGMADRIERIQRIFLWSGMGEKNKLSLVNREVVYKPKEKGGLGVRRLKDLNKALVAKVGWRLGKSTVDWSKIMKTKYLSNTQFS